MFADEDLKNSEKTGETTFMTDAVSQYNFLTQNLRFLDYHSQSWLPQPWKNRANATKVRSCLGIL